MSVYPTIISPEYIGLAWNFQVDPTSCDNSQKTVCY
jgi:hypothetical protein